MIDLVLFGFSLIAAVPDLGSYEMTSVAVHDVSFKFEVKVQLFCRPWYRRSWLTRDMRGSSEASKNGRMLGGDETPYELRRVRMLGVRSLLFDF
jgi:hypothetical protein